MSKQSARSFGGNMKAAPVGRGASKAHGGGEIGRVAAIPPGRSAVKKGGLAKAKAMPRPIRKAASGKF